MSEQRPIYGDATVCLHCLVWRVINDHAPPFPGEPSKKLYDARLIVGNLVDVIAELIAGARDRNERREFIRLAEERLRDQVRANVATGNHPEGREVKLQ